MVDNNKTEREKLIELLKFRKTELEKTQQSNVELKEEIENFYKSNSN